MGQKNRRVKRRKTSTREGSHYYVGGVGVNRGSKKKKKLGTSGVEEKGRQQLWSHAKSATAGKGEGVGGAEQSHAF